MRNHLRYTGHTTQRYKYQRIEGYLSVSVNLILFVSKIVVGLTVHSLSLIADAFHSISDMVTSFIVILSSKVSSKPPDTKHPYGHERFEHIATFAVSVLLAVTGIELIKEGISGLHKIPEIKYSFSLLLFILATIIIKAVLGAISHLMGKKSNASILKVDAMHHYTDAASSLLVMIAVIAYRLGFPYLDGLFASFIGLALIYTGFTYSRSTMDILIGQAPDKELIRWIKEISMSTGLVKNIHDVMIHSYGKRKFISFHIEIDKNLSQEEAHEIVETLRNKIRQEVDASITIHVDPVDIKSEEIKKIEKIIKSFIRRNNFIKEYHDLRLVNRDKHKLILFDIAVEQPDPEELNDAVKQITLAIKESYPEYEVRITIDPEYYY